MFAKDKQAWLDALEFSNYTQGRARLKQRVNDTDRFCCLGVLCDIQEGVQWTDCESDEYNNITFRAPTIELESGERIEIGGFGSLTSRGMNKFGLSIEQISQLIKMNDDEDKTFAEIAEWIRENV